jgi:hypothetical protein
LREYSIASKQERIRYQQATNLTAVFQYYDFAAQTPKAQLSIT